MKQTKHKKHVKHGVHDGNGNRDPARRLHLGDGLSWPDDIPPARHTHAGCDADDLWPISVSRLARISKSRHKKRHDLSGDDSGWRSILRRRDPAAALHRVAPQSDRCWSMDLLFHESELAKRSEYATVQELFTGQVIAVQQLENPLCDSPLHFFAQVCDEFGSPAFLFVPQHAQFDEIVSQAEIHGAVVVPRPRLVAVPG
jgi:hypothetical protein